MVNLKFNLKRNRNHNERTKFLVIKTPVIFIIYFIYYSKCLTLKKVLRTH